MFGEIRCSRWGDPAIPSTGYRVKLILSFLSISGAIYPVTAIWVALSPRANDPSRLSLPLWEMHIRSVLCVCRVFSCGEDGLCYSEKARMHLSKLFWALTLSSQRACQIIRVHRLRSIHYERQARCVSRSPFIRCFVN